MPDFRVYHRPTAGEQAQLRLSPEESHHLVVVNRARTGDPVIAFDGAGQEWETILVEARKQAAVLDVRHRRPQRERGPAITLAQALPKGSVMDAIVRKATEIGAARIIPLESERSQVHLDAARSDRKADKWLVAAIEAAKQCGNPFLPEILPIQGLTEWVSSATPAGEELRLIASLAPGARTLKRVLEARRAAGGAQPTSATWLIGPEGDFSPEETALALAHGFQPVTLGPLVLRSDTAAVYALSILSYELSPAD